MGLNCEVEEWCERCGTNTLHRTEHKRMEGPGVHYKLRDYCQKCGRVKREIQFR